MANQSSSRRVDPSVIAALIGVIGTIIVTLITINANKPQAAHPTSTAVPTLVVFTETATFTPVPTDTAAPGEPSSTPEPPTDTPEPTFTAVPPVTIGEDWGQSCISTAWKPYPSNVPVLDNGNGCWKNPVQVFLADNGRLVFVAQRTTNGLAEIYGLFAPLPESGSVSIHVSLKDLSNVDLLMGVYAEADVASQGLLMTIPSGNVKKRIIVQKDNVINYQTLQSTSSLDQGNGFWLTFTFTPNSASSTVNPSVFVTNPVSIPSATKWFFIGYKGLSGSYRIEGNFFGLELK